MMVGIQTPLLAGSYFWQTMKAIYTVIGFVGIVGGLGGLIYKPSESPWLGVTIDVLGVTIVVLARRLQVN